MRSLERFGTRRPAATRRAGRRPRPAADAEGLRARLARLRHTLDNGFDRLVGQLPPGFARARTGRVGAAVLLAGFGLYGAWLVSGDAAAHPHVVALAERTGFALERVEISGHAHLDEGDVLDLVGIVPGVALPLIDAEATRQRLVASPWIASAVVRKLYPDRLGVDIVEADPIAIWQHSGVFEVIARDGHPMSQVFARNLPDLPLVVGPAANLRAADLFDAIARHPAVAEQTSTAISVAGRRWNLKLSPGLDVLLPETELHLALAQLDRLIVDHGLLDRAVDRIDLRLPDRIVLRVMEEAADDEDVDGNGEGRS